MVIEKHPSGGERWSQSDRRLLAIEDTAYHGTETIVLVEDDDAVRHVTRRALEGAGYTVLDAASGPGAIRAAKAYDGPIQLIIADVVMPDMSGPASVERIRAARAGVPALYISGHADDVLDAHGVADRTRHFVRKPFTPSELMRAIRELLD
jgi:two-component system, cell cycle sensor histidine kinase and response regulator CckA